MKTGKTKTCREVRKKLQDYLDKQGATASGDRSNFGRFMPLPLQEHLDRCSDCRRYWEDISGFIPILRGQIDGAVQAIPVPDVEGIVSRRARESIRPSSRPALVFRRTALSLAGLVLVVFVGLQIRENVQANRAIEREIERIVDTIYREPLLSDVESGLIRYRSGLSKYIEDFGRTGERWLESPGNGDFLY